MNTTLNINLAGTFFHIDEAAYQKLKKYLKIIEDSLSGDIGKEEIMNDIEARISELFVEKLTHERQVIGLQEVEEVIAIMGQPEDFVIEGEESQKSESNKVRKFFRDPDDQFISGVAAGVAHYLGLDTKLVRLLWLALAVFSWGGFFIFYIVLWAVIPVAKTTAEKLSMRGKPVNISNIEKRIKEELDDVSERVRSVDYEKAGNGIASFIKQLIQGLLQLLLILVKAIGKFIGLLFILVGGIGLVGLFIGLFSASIFDVLDFPFFEFSNYTHVPFWIMSLLAFLVVGIPLLFLVMLGIRVLSGHATFRNRTLKYSLVGLWLLSIVGIIGFGLAEAKQYAYEGAVVKRHEWKVFPTDTLQINILEDNNFTYRYSDEHPFEWVEDEHGKKWLYSEDIKLKLKSTSDSIPNLKVEKSARGSSFKQAKENAATLVYPIEFINNSLRLPNHFLADSFNPLHDLEVKLVLYLPVEKPIRFDDNLQRLLGWYLKRNPKIDRDLMWKYTWQMSADGTLNCLDCSDEKNRSVQLEKNNHFKLKIDKEGIELRSR